MLFLTDIEIQQWIIQKNYIVENHSSPDVTIMENIRPGLRPAFHYYIGTSMLTAGKTDLGREWLASGIPHEQGGLFSNSFLTSFLNRTNGKLIIPETIFEDARPFIHFAGVPIMKNAREQFIHQCGQSLPVFNKPVTIMDIGCGPGDMVVNLLKHLHIKGIIPGVEEVLLIDPYTAMLDLAEKAVRKAFPDARVVAVKSKIEHFTDKINHHYNIALASLAYHHMPFETKEFHLNRLKNRIDFFIIQEMDANHDTPEVGSPELAVSIYQAYGSIIDFVFSFDAPVEIALASIDKFLMSEAISLLTEPRGKRNDYHMLNHQWHDVFKKGLGKDFSCYCDSPVFGDENLGLFTMIYGKNMMK